MIRLILLIGHFDFISINHFKWQQMWHVFISSSLSSIRTNIVLSAEFQNEIFLIREVFYDHARAYILILVSF